MSQKQKHILVIRLSAMGDVAMSVPVLRAFSKQHPNIKITVLTQKSFASFFRDLPNIHVFHADLKAKHKGLLGLYKLSKEVKKRDIDCVADLHNVLRTKILKFFFFGKKTIQINKGRTAKKALTKGKAFKQLKTTHERYADVFRAFGFKLDLAKPTFSEPAIISPQAQKLIGLDNKHWIGIAPFAHYESKMYPLDLIEKVIEQLAINHKVLLFGGGKKEAKILNTFKTKYSNVVNLANLFDLNQELNIISNLDVMLSMDSGNAHLAAMLGKKVVTIWNVTHPFAGFAPFNQPENFAITANRVIFPLIPTSVYGNKYPEHYKEAARTILPETIVSKIEGVL